MDINTMNSAADNIRVLIAEMVERANSGHPGGSIGAADFINVLYSKFLVYDPEDPHWFMRDRFFLDPGHMSPMLYAVLALTGKYSIDDLKDFRQWGSVTPGHPELDVNRGIENSSGPLGQGHVMAVGCAIAERFLAARFGEVVSHKTYTLISDGGIQEEISQGAARIAGHLGLHNLVMFYDSNKVQLSTKVDQVDTEDVAAKYRAWNWNVIEVNGSDPEAISSALVEAINEHERPTLIIGHTVMARKVVNSSGGSLEGAVSTHGQPLSKAGADLALTVKTLGGDPENPWVIRPEVKQLYDERARELQKIVDERRRQFEKWGAADPDQAKLLESYIKMELPDLDWSNVEIKPDQASRVASSACLAFLAENVGNMIVSSADLANSDKTDGFLKKTGQLLKNNFSGGFLQAGVAELTMAAIMNGIALHGGVYAACGTFFVFSDYMKPAIRMAALMELPVKFIYSHDSFRVGEDGPTHEPIEHEAQIRLLEQMNNLAGHRSLLVIRPADSAETVAAYAMAMENDKTPTVLIFSRQNLEDLPGENRREEAMKARRGGYCVKSCVNPDVVLVANGSDVALLLHAADRLAEDGIRAQVVSMPSIGLFMDQDEAYQRSVLPAGVKTFALTSGLPAVFYPVLRGDFEIMGLQRFGASAPAKVLEAKFGYTVDSVTARILAFLHNK